MRPHCFVVLAAVIQLVVGITTLAAPSQAKPRTAAAAPPLYATTAFDVGAQAVPRSYRGMDCVRVAAALRRLSLEKGQYETTTAYEERLATLRAKSALYGSVHLGDMLAFKVLGPLETEYDADKSVLTLPSPSGETAFAGSDAEMFSAWRVVVLRASQSSYTGSNAFGVKARIQSTNVETCGVLEKETRLHDPVTVPADVALAKTVRSSLGMLVIGTVASPYVAEGVLNAHSPTISEPFDRTVTITGIVLAVKHIWYYDARTGEVYHRQKIDGGNGDATKPNRALHPTAAAR